MGGLKGNRAIVFVGSDGKELCAMTADDVFEGEISATLALLAYENGIDPCSITIAEIGSYQGWNH